MLELLVTEQANPASQEIDILPVEDLLRLMNEEDFRVAPAVRAEIPNIAAAVTAIARALRRGGRLFLVGAGTSGRLGVLEATECPPTFGIPPEQVQAVIAGGERALFQALDAFEDDAAAGRGDVTSRGLGTSDVLVAVSASGESAYVLGAVDAAKGVGALTVGISCNAASALRSRVDISITPMTGPEIIAGSTRLKAATAAKLVLNMLTTGAMVQLGHVYRNLMVNVQPGNRKLRQRAVRIVATALGIDGQRAAELLEEAGDSAKTAIVMGRLRLPREEAERRLRRSGGHISRALQDNPP